MSNTTGAGAAVDVARVRNAAAERLDDDLDLLAQLVAIDSSRDRPAGIEAVELVIADRLARLGAVAVWDDGAVPHVLLRLAAGERRVVIVTHADTVFAAGTAAARPYERDGDIVRGPGVVDMKGGLVLAVCALEVLAAIGATHTSVDLLIVGDEEVRTTPPPFMDVLGTADAALVLECGRPGGGFVTSRKAGLWASVVATGRAAHSGTSKSAGSNAVDALAAEVVRIAELDRDRPDVSVSTSMFSGGTAVNSVPARAEAWFDVRAPGSFDLAWVLAAMRDFDRHAGIALELVPTEQWPAMTPTGDAWALAKLYESLAVDLGVEARQVATGGMSDGSWLSAAGVPTIDGLGPIGDADHSPEEWMQVSSFPVRSAMLAGLLVELEWPGPWHQILE